MATMTAAQKREARAKALKAAAKKSPAEMHNEDFDPSHEETGPDNRSEEEGDMVHNEGFDPTHEETGPDNRSEPEAEVHNEGFDPSHEETGPDNRPNDFERNVQTIASAGDNLHKIAGQQIDADEIEGDTVTMVFSNPVRLTLANHQFIEFSAGINEVPADLASHWYLKAHGVAAHSKHRKGKK